MEEYGIFLRDASQVETGKFAEVAATLFCVSASELEVLRNKLQNGGPLTFFALEANINGGEAKITSALQGFRYETATGIHAAALANQETALWDATATLLTQEWQPRNAAKDYASVLGQLSACALLDCHAQAQQETEYLHGRVFQLNNVHIPFPPPEHLYEDRKQLDRSYPRLLAAWTWGFVRKQRVTSLASPRSSVPTVPLTLCLGRCWPV